MQAPLLASRRRTNTIGAGFGKMRCAWRYLLSQETPARPVDIYPSNLTKNATTLVKHTDSTVKDDRTCLHEDVAFELVAGHGVERFGEI